jgi:hypothetical protein
MKPLIAVTVLWLAIASTMVNASEGTIVPGSNIEVASKSMAASGYRETGLDMLPAKKETELKFWSVAEGVLIAVYSTTDKKVLSLSYWLCDERPKATRKEFELMVNEFDPQSGEMKIHLPKKAPAAARQATRPS